MQLSMRMEYGGYAMDIWPFVMLAMLGWVGLRWWRNRSWPDALCALIFGVYGLYLLDVVFFPIWFDGSLADASRQISLTENINLIPFNFGQRRTFSTELPGLLLNIALTIPFGFGLPFIKGRHVRRIWLWALGLGFMLETVQLLISLGLGYAYRQIDINDVLMNVLGVLLGYGAFRVFAALYVRLIKRLDQPPTGLIGHVYKVAQR
ncbi:MAG: VanZ family protein [Anaerolineae bacterium]|jgi:glycopeptide antibiotics resistance protein|nr:VanZ family protein [Anaerolineae bacterium]